jgi:predicted TIM-barrel fold metal-dependent hydrolase
MQLDDLILVSVDDHVVEPPDVFHNQLTAAELERAPKVVRLPNGADVWEFEGAQIPNIGLNAVAGRPRAEYGIDPTSFEEMRKGCYDIHARIDDMNANGVLGSLCFPSFPQFCGQLFSRAQDKEFAFRLLQAYNDWHIDEWCGAYPGRFLPLALPPIWDVDLMVDEVRRVAAKGCHAISFSENPAKLGFPSLHHSHWDPFWQICSDVGTVVCMHIGSSSQLVVTADDAPFDVMATLQPLNIVQAAADLVWSPVLRKFPHLRIALSEGGIGWIPYFLDKIDNVYRKQHEWTGQDYGGRKPSEVFLEQILVCFIDDRAGMRLLDDLNVDNVTWECDYPHSDSEWPRAPESVMAIAGAIDDDTINRITHRNAMTHFRYDPFAHLPREECTVGALRAKASHVDVSERSMTRRELSGARSSTAMTDLFEDGARAG